MKSTGKKSNVVRTITLYVQHRAQVFKKKYLAGLHTNTLEINSVMYFTTEKNPSRIIKS